MNKIPILKKRPEEKVKPSSRKELGFGLARVGNNLVAEYRLPGVDDKDVHFEVGKYSLKIKAASSREAKVEKKGFYSHSFSKSAFYKEIPLPARVDAEKANAEFKNGVLRITAPITAASIQAGNKQLERSKVKKLVIN